jgi:tetratricopeptide (TPR) repeat protein
MRRSLSVKKISTHPQCCVAFKWSGRASVKNRRLSQEGLSGAVNRFPETFGNTSEADGQLVAEGGASNRSTEKDVTSLKKTAYFFEAKDCMKFLVPISRAVAFATVFTSSFVVGATELGASLPELMRIGDAALEFVSKDRQDDGEKSEGLMPAGDQTEKTIQITQDEHSVSVRYVVSFNRRSKQGEGEKYKRLIKEGEQAATVRRFDEALKKYTEAIRLQPDEVDGYNRRAGVFLNLDLVDRAVADLEKAMQVTKNEGQSRRFRGLIRALRGDVEGAAADLTEAIRLNPADARSYSSRGIFYSQTKDYDRAIADFGEAIRLDPAQYDHYGNRAIAYTEKEDYDRALADVNRAIEIEPKDPNSYVIRSNIYAAKGDHDAVIADCTQAISTDPKFFAGYLNRGLAHFRKKQYDQAIADYNQAIRLDSKDPRPYYNRGGAYLNQGDRKRAVEDYRKALKLYPQFEPAKERLEELGEKP